MMKWSDFKTTVLDELVFEGDRKKYQAFLQRQIRFAALDLQREVAQYRVGHTTRYTGDDIEVRGQAGIISLPGQETVENVFLEPERAFLPTTREKLVTTAASVAEVSHTAYFEDGTLNGKKRWTPRGKTSSTSISAGDSIVWDSATQEFLLLVDGVVQFKFTDDVAIPEGQFETSSAGAPAPSTTHYEASRLSLEMPDSLSGSVTLSVSAWVRGKSGEVLRVSADGVESDTSAIAEDDVWEKHSFTLNIGTVEDRDFIYLGYDGTDYTEAEWSEIPLESGEFSQVIFLGEDQCDRLYTTKKLAHYPWARRRELITGDTCTNDPGNYTENGAELWAYPLDKEAFDAGAAITVETVGRKLEFNDADDTPFDEYAVNAASLYVRYKMLKHIDKLNDGWKVQQDYERERAMLIADQNAR